MERWQDAKQESLLKFGVFNPIFRQVKDELFLDNEFFDSRDLIQVKYEMLRRNLLEGMPATRAAELFGFSRTTFYQALRAFQKGGLYGLVSARPGPKGAHKLTVEVVAFIEEEFARDPSLRLADITESLRMAWNLSVHPRSIQRALARRKKRA